MTTTTTRAKWYPTRNSIVAIAATAAAVATIAISQWLGTDTLQRVSATDSGTSGLVEPLNSGKFDAGLSATASISAASSTPAPLTVSINGQGGLYDALIAGKFATDFAPQYQYVPATEGAVSSGLVKALNDGKFNEDAAVDTSAVHSSPPATRTPTVSGGHQQ